MIEPIHNIDNNNDKEDEKDNFLSLNNNKPLIPKEQIQIKKKFKINPNTNTNTNANNW